MGENIDFEREKAISELAAILRDCPPSVATALLSEMQRSVTGGKLRSVYRAGSSVAGRPA